MGPQASLRSLKGFGSLAGFRELQQASENFSKLQRTSENIRGIQKASENLGKLLTNFGEFLQALENSIKL
jgi:hypothetical protein